MDDLKAHYRQTVRPALQSELGLSSLMAVPRLQKVTLNMGVGDAYSDRKILESALSDLRLLSGQKAVATRARKSVAGFKIRAGWTIGCKVTLRSARMYDFLQRLIQIVIPRIRDFRGLNPTSFDGHGNFSMGVREQIIFPEIDYDKTDRLRGLDIVISTTAKTDDQARALLKALNFPFRS